MKSQTDNINEEDLIEEVKFEVDKDAFKGPFTCHNKKTKKEIKKMSMKGIDFSYDVWKCTTCKKEFLDSEQAKRLEKIWMIEKLLDEKLITVERNVNFDGKTYFVRFPVDLTKNWHKGAHADITLLGPDEFLIKIKA